MGERRYQKFFRSGRALHINKLAKFIICIFAGLILFGCSKPYYGTAPGKYFNNNTGKVWVVGTDGTVETNDFKELQLNTPFEIIRPSYLPSELELELVMYQKYEVVDKEEKYVNIYFYYTSGTRKMIRIEEQNTENNILEFNEQHKPAYFDLNGIEIVRLDLGYYDSTQEITYYRFDYLWHKDGISFLVITTDYNEYESQKVIESMIR